MLPAPAEALWGRLHEVLRGDFRHEPDKAGIVLSGGTLPPRSPGAHRRALRPGARPRARGAPRHGPRRSPCSARRHGDATHRTIGAGAPKTASSRQDRATRPKAFPRWNHTSTRPTTAHDTTAAPDPLAAWEAPQPTRPRRPRGGVLHAPSENEMGDHRAVPYCQVLPTEAFQDWPCEVSRNVSDRAKRQARGVNRRRHRVGHLRACRQPDRRGLLRRAARRRAHRDAERRHRHMAEGSHPHRDPERHALRLLHPARPLARAVARRHPRDALRTRYEPSTNSACRNGTTRCASTIRGTTTDDRSHRTPHAPPSPHAPSGPTATHILERFFADPQRSDGGYGRRRRNRPRGKAQPPHELRHRPRHHVAARSARVLRRRPASPCASQSDGPKLGFTNRRERPPASADARAPTRTASSTLFTSYPFPARPTTFAEMHGHRAAVASNLQIMTGKLRGRIHPRPRPRSHRTSAVTAAADRDACQGAINAVPTPNARNTPTIPATKPRALPRRVRQRRGSPRRPVATPER